MEVRLGKMEKDIEYLKEKFDSFETKLDNVTVCLIGRNMSGGVLAEHHRNCERLKDVESEVSKIRTMIYGISVTIVMYVLNSLLGLL